MIKQLILVLILFSASLSQALSFSPPASSEGVISISNSAQIISIINDSANEISMNLSISQTGLEKFVDRCSGKVLKPRSSCYITFLTLSRQASFSAELKNNGSRIAYINFSSSSSSSSSIFAQSSISLNDFSNKEVIITNQSSSSKSYSPILSGTDAAKYEIVLNRCQNISAGKSCPITLRLKPQPNGSYSASLTESQISSGLSINSSISGSSVSSLSQSLSLSTSSLNFGTLTKFSDSPAQIVSLTNTGNSTLSNYYNFYQC